MAEDRYTKPRVMSARRMEALSDGVFAIAITLLVLEIGIPSGATDLLDAFWHEWPSYLAYVISFATIGGVWLGHNVITVYLAHADSRLMRLNLVLLMVIAFLPFPPGCSPSTSAMTSLSGWRRPSTGSLCSPRRLGLGDVALCDPSGADRGLGR